MKNKNDVVRGDILEFLYIGMLEKLTVDQIKEFWLHEIPGFSYKFSSERALFESMWFKSQWLDTADLFYILRRMEGYLARIGYPPERFIVDLFSYFSDKNVIFARSFLMAALDHLGVFYSDGDIYSEILGLLPLFLKKIAPSFSINVETVSNDGLVVKSGLALWQSCGTKPFDLNVGLWVGAFVRLFPLLFELEPFQVLTVIADPRLLSSVHPDQSSEKIPYDTFLAEQGIKAAPILRRTHVEKLSAASGSEAAMAFSSPIAVIEVSHERLQCAKAPFLKKIITHASSVNKDEWQRLKEHHEAVLQSLDKTMPASIVYYVKDESIAINGEHFVKSVPAQIFRKMVIEYQASGRTDFEYREFLRDETIVLDPLNPNLSVRVQRLHALLAQRGVCFSVEKTGRGKIALVVDGEFVYSEVE